VVFKSLLPKTVDFIKFFEDHGVLVKEVCAEFLALTDHPEEIPSRAARIKEIEQQADIITHQCIGALHNTFITQMDRADIHQLMKRLDDIIDYVHAATSRIMLYEITEIRIEAHELAEVLVKSSNEICLALTGLRHISKATHISEQCATIHRLEDQGDFILRSAVVRLFKEHDQPILVIKWKEIYERLEKATDRCADVADIIEKVVIESS
jgi:uncharacterized protein Yka (UPF0111/DUF47 family)